MFLVRLPGGAQFVRRRLWFERQTLLVVREDRLTESGAVEATIQYEDFRAIGEWWFSVGMAIEAI